MRLLLIASLAAALFGGCAKRIGDDCSNNSDCSPDGDRLCDRSAGVGYCTIEGCDRGTCPDEAVCVRFFSTRFLPTGGPDCRQNPAANGGCPDDAVCLTSTGQCAPRSVERRFCMRECTVPSDCRSEFTCARTGDTAQGGLAGAEAVPEADGTANDTRFCAFNQVSE